MNQDNNLLQIVEAKKEPGVFDWLIEHGPAIALVFANLGVIFGEVRVFDIIRTLTGQDWKAAGAILSTGLPFMLWELLWQYRIASGFQRFVALCGSGLAFLSAVALGVMDYVVIKNTDGTVTNIPADSVLTAVVILLGVHVLAAFLYFYLDPKVARQRVSEQKRAEFEDKAEKLALAAELLAQAEKVLATQNDLVSTYGDAANTLINELAGDKKAIQHSRVEEKPTPAPVPFRTPSR